MNIEEQLETKELKERIKELEENLKKKVCSNIPNAFWNRKKHIVELPYEKNFDESRIPTKARPIQMNEELLEYCKKEINELLEK